MWNEYGLSASHHRSNALGWTLGNLSFATLFIAACTDLGARTEYLTGPEAFTWESDTRFKVAAEPDMWGQVAIYDNEISLFVKGFPPGTVIRAGAAEATVDDEGDAMVKSPSTGLFGAAPVPQERDGTVSQGGVGFEVQVAGQPAVVVPIPELKVQPTRLLEQVSLGPVVFLGEDSASGAVDNALLLGPVDHVLVGTAAALRDLDAVAVPVRTGDTARTCTGYTADGQAAPDIQLLLKSTDVTLYERRTGKVLASQSFPPNDECPSFVTSRAGEKTVRESVFPEKEIEAWLRTVVPAPAH